MLIHVSPRWAFGQEANVWNVIEEKPFYLYFFAEREKVLQVIVEIHESWRRRQGNHHVNFILQFWMFDHGNEKAGRTERMAHINQFRLTVGCQYVIDVGWDVVFSQLVPSEWRIRKE